MPANLIISPRMKPLSGPAYRMTLGSARRFAQSIAELAPERRADAIAAAERYYMAVLRQFGYAHSDCQPWVVMTMFALIRLVREFEQSTVANQRAALGSVLKPLEVNAAE